MYALVPLSNAEIDCVAGGRRGGGGYNGNTIVEIIDVTAAPGSTVTINAVGIGNGNSASTSSSSGHRHR